ncbi:MAG: 23S rRNA (uracil(1939)-C(5))-methyltransferase RlmD [Oscillospiraceae bacterium]|nr:23S rRNA (uracil(1939)-C(5))-methyltransferase RlmD [Oscillospiraceae bacterium]MBQ9907972.1 23S rRNA (uracil(1939)-C(5))-methyltransferase RlmD [Oscillospiraceae bacterium]
MNRQIITDPKTGEKICRCFKRCGGCQLAEPYAEQIRRKQEKAERMLSKFAKVRPIIAMDEPYYYRCKVQNVYGRGRGGEIISGIFQSTGQKMVSVDDCMLEDRRAAPIIRTLKQLMRDFRIQPYDLRTGSGLLRHTLIRTSASTGEIMLVLVTAAPMLPAKKNLIAALQKAHPELTTIVQNICPDGLPLTLGDRSIVLAGKGYIEDVLCGCRFRISPASFYQVNPVQTEKLYAYAVEAAEIHAGVTVIDAYCGTGTIGMICAKQGAEVIGVEVNRSACKDAAENARRNQLANIRFCNEDAGKFMQRMAKEGGSCDVLLMDPPRAGASTAFLRAAAALLPERIVYVSCKIETLERDLKQLVQSGYRVTDIQPVDMFPHTTGIETVCVLHRKSGSQRR